MFRINLRQVLLSLTLSTPLLALSTSHVAAQDIRDFMVNNRTNRTLTEINVSSADLENWGPDILGVDVLYPGETVEVLFNPYTADEGCIYDIRAQWEDGNTTELYDYNLCTITDVNFTP